MAEACGTKSFLFLTGVFGQQFGSSAEDRLADSRVGRRQRRTILSYIEHVRSRYWLYLHAVSVRTSVHPSEEGPMLIRRLAVVVVLSGVVAMFASSRHPAAAQ